MHITSSLFIKKEKRRDHKRLDPGFFPNENKEVSFCTRNALPY
jgi:hypothetical protein